MRDIRLVDGSINATMAGGCASGTGAESYNVLTASGGAVGTVTLNGSFTATRR